MTIAGLRYHKFPPVFLVLISLLISAAGEPAQSPPKTVAVIIGISRYPGLPGGQQLQFAERDAQSFAAALQSAGVSSGNIRLLAGQQANLSAIKEALGSWLARTAGTQDTAIIFFSGHGYVEQSFNESYLLAADSSLQNVFATALSLSDIKHIVETRMRAGRVVILQDSIRKDLFNPDSDGPGLTETFFKATGEIAGSRPNTSVMLACSPGEFSWEGRRWGDMGVFTKTLIEGIAGKADRNGDGSVTDVEVFRYLSDQLPAETSGKQHPWRSSASATEAVLSSKQIGGSRITASVPSTATSAGTRNKNGSVEGDRSARAEPGPAAKATTEKQANVAPPSYSVPQPIGTAHVDATDRSRSTGVAAVNEPGLPAGAKSPVESTDGSRPSVGMAAPAKSPPGTPRDSVPTSGPTPGATGSPRKSAPVPPSTVTPEPGGSAASSGGPVTGIAAREVPAPPRPMVLPPNPSSIGTKPEIATGTAPVGSLPVTTAGTTPSPLVLQMEVAIAEGSLVSPAGSSAWDLYQRLTAMEPPATELPHLKSKLIEALMSRSKAIVAGDVRSDNISSNVDDFRLAGQMLTRLKGFEPDNADINRLQKLSAAEALIALQFYDEAAKALEPLRTPPTGWVENALGLASVGQLSDFEAERHFKHAIEFDPKWAAPHYNLALLYRNQKKEASLAELEQAARLDGSNPAILAALGDEYFERKQWGEAASAYRGAVTASPGDDALHTKLGHALYSQGMRAEADKEYQKAKELANTRK